MRAQEADHEGISGMFCLPASFDLPIPIAVLTIYLVRGAVNVKPVEENQTACTAC